ncbi:MAG: trigger factor, partial [Muribaculaceae bacterium]|nr:trigger factor [Muribaculaceae bacterium]
KGLAEMGFRHPPKGFRAGHVPQAMLKRMYGSEVLANVIDRKVSRELVNYIEKEKLDLLGEPMVSPDTKVDLNTEKEFSFKFDVGIAPEFDVTVDKTVTIPYYIIEVSQQMVDNSHASNLKRFGKQVKGEVSDEESLLRGSLTELDENGAEKEGGLKVERTVISPKYLKDDEQKTLFVAHKVGDEIVFNPFKAADGNLTEVAAMLNIDKDKAEIHADFKFDVDDIVVFQDADVDQELFDNVLGKDVAKNEEEYFAKLKESIANQLKNESNYRFTIDVEKVLRKQVGDLQLPDDFLKRFLLSRDENKDPEKFEAQYPETRKHLQWHLIKEKVARKLDVKINEEDKMRVARFYAAHQFAQYGMSNLPDDVIDNYAKRMLDDDRTKADITERAFEDKLFAVIKDTVTLKEKKVSEEAFNKLFAEG